MSKRNAVAVEPVVAVEPIVTVVEPIAVVEPVPAEVSKQKPTLAPSARTTPHKLTAKQRKDAEAFFTGLATDFMTGEERWSNMRSYIRIAGQVIDELNVELRKLCVDSFIAKKRAIKDAELTADEVLKFKRRAEQDYYRGMRNPDEKRKARGTSAAALAKKALIEAGKQAMAQKAPDASTGDANPISVAAELRKIQTRVGSITAALVLFQTHVAIPENGKALIAELALEVDKLKVEVETAINVAK